MRPVHGDVLHNEIALRDQVVLLERDRTEVVLDGLQDLSETITTLRVTKEVLFRLADNDVVVRIEIGPVLRPE